MSVLSLGSAALAAKLAALAAKARGYGASIGRAYLLRPANLPPEEARKLLWFHGGTRRQPERPILRLDKRTATAARKAIVARLREGLATNARELPMIAALTLGAQAIRGVWLDRLLNSGADVRIAPLSKSYRDQKRRRGLDPRPGIATSDTALALAKCPVVVFKVR